MKSDINVNSIRNRDAGMVVALAGFLLFKFYGIDLAFWGGIIALVVNMAVPSFFSPFAKVWFSLADRLSSFMSVLILIVIYICIVCPVSIIIKIFGYDPLLIGKWGKSKGSHFIDMHTEISNDNLDKPYKLIGILWIF